MKTFLTALLFPSAAFAALIGFKVGNDYFVAGQYDLNAKAAVFRDDCTIATVDAPDPNRSTEFASFLFSPVMRAAMYRMCSCTADEMQRQYPDRMEPIHRAFNSGVSRNTQEERLAEMHQVIAEYGMTEEQMIGLFDDIGSTIRGCTAKQS